MTEAQLQAMISRYISLQYPNVLFNVDLSGIKLPIGLARKVAKLRSGRAYPDMVIYARRGRNGALFLELKKETPFKKNGGLKAGEHLHEQNDMIFRLQREGYAATFVWDFEQAKQIIDEYLK